MKNATNIATTFILVIINATLAVAQGQVSNMTSNCSFEAAKFFRGDVADIDIKYEGQRTDGTHAVNGTIYLETRKEDFQCSFAANGIDISDIRRT